MTLAMKNVGSAVPADIMWIVFHSTDLNKVGNQLAAHYSYSQAGFFHYN